MNRKQKLILVLVGFLFLCFALYTFVFEKEENVVAQEVVKEQPKEENLTEEFYRVDVKGQVEKPGVYEIKKDSRVIDVLQLAGGVKKNGNTDFLNLSKKVEDGSVIWVYTEDEIKKLKDGKTVIEYIEKECNCPDVSNSACIGDKNNSNPKVNINTASLEELQTLTGVGESKAKAIIEYRKTKPFTTIEDLKNVSGIGDSAFEKIKEFITI